MNLTRLCTLLTSLGLAGSASAALPRWLDPTARDAARARAAQNPLGLGLRDRVNQDLAALGYGPHDRFELVRANQDELGWTHGHLRQTYYGAPVEGGRLTVHQRPDGTVAPYADRGVRGISTSPSPRFTAAEAIQIAERDPAHRGSWVDPPRVELSWLPIYELRLARGGGPVPPPKYPQDVPHAMPDPINSDDVVKRLVRVHLVWRVSGVELAAGSYAVQRWTIDAHDGAVLEVQDLGDEVVGNGDGFWNPGVQFETTDQGSCFTMYDGIREFTTETEDFGSGHAVNCDGNNQWGDGLAFAGDASATTSNWQTAMVDIHFGATVYWDLLDNVFGFQGPDDDFYSVNAFVHGDTNWDNAKYHQLSGNVSFGDGSNGVNRTVLDCAGHELAHAWNDHNTGFDGTADNLNESLADVFGEWTDAYLASGGFAGSASTVGNNNHPDWRNNCSGRGLINPKMRYWVSNISDYEEHLASGPASRAFVFLARGSSSWMRNPNYSRKLVWGMNGIGLHPAARTYFRAHRDHVEDHDEAGVRKALLKSAEELFGLNTTEWRAVRNAYHGINVGVLDPTYPAGPPATAEVEPNDSSPAAQFIGRGTPPPPGAVLPAPNKILLIGGGDNPDFYRASAVGSVVTVNLSPLFGLGGAPTYRLSVWDTNGQLIGASGPSTNPMQVDLDYQVPASRQIIIRVLPVGAPSNALYQLEVDLGT